MLTDIEIAKKSKMTDIREIAGSIGINEDNLETYGKYKAKVTKKLDGKGKDGKVILVTAINPTPAGEGKTTTTIGLADAFTSLGKNAIIAIREPSLGPVFGMKGGAAGGGYSQVLPMEDINLHFTGDMHAVGCANNLLCALIDNHIKWGNELNINPQTITFRRAIDMNERQLRNIVSGMGGPNHGVPREDGFDITVASEVMAIFCLANDIFDLKEKLSKIVVGYSYDKKPITAGDLKAQGAMTALLKDAIKPNLVQTIEKTPAFIHGGPFANIAHGCNSVIATKLAKYYGDYVITEAGFGADLGAEKFLNIKCRQSDIKPSAVVIVATIKALKYNGFLAKEELSNENVDALKIGLENLYRHVSNIKEKFKLPVVVALNKFSTDTKHEIETFIKECNSKNIEVSICECFANGSKGAIDLATKVENAINTQENNFEFLYDENLDIKSKIEKIAKEIYRADGVIFEKMASDKISQFEKDGYKNLPICMAKTQFSFTDVASKLGSPTGFKITIKDATLSAGAGFVVALSGNILKMPGLSKNPSAFNIDIDEKGEIIGLF